MTHFSIIMQRKTAAQRGANLPFFSVKNPLFFAEKKNFRPAFSLTGVGPSKHNRDFYYVRRSYGDGKTTLFIRGDQLPGHDHPLACAQPFPRAAIFARIWAQYPIPTYFLLNLGDGRSLHFFVALARNG